LPAKSEEVELRRLSTEAALLPPALQLSGKWKTVEEVAAALTGDGSSSIYATKMF